MSLMENYNRHIIKITPIYEGGDADDQGKILV